MKLSSSDRKALVKLAGTLPKGSKERRAILAGLKTAWASRRAGPRRGSDRTAFNKENPSELMSQLIKILSKAELDEAVATVKGITRDVQDAWNDRER